MLTSTTPEHDIMNPVRTCRTRALQMSVGAGDKLPLTTTFQELVDGKPTVS